MSHHRADARERLRREIEGPVGESDFDENFNEPEVMDEWDNGVLEDQNDDRNDNYEDYEPEVKIQLCGVLS